MRYLIITLLVVTTCAAAIGAQKLEVEKKGTYVYWFAYTDGLGNEQVTQPVKFKGDSTDLDVAALGTTFKKAKLLVMNKKSGNLAVVDYAAPSSLQVSIPGGMKGSPKNPKAVKPIEVKDDAFTYVRQVRLKAVAEDGSPVESGLVEITDGEGTAMRAVVTPADEGVATFENVGMGEISVKVRAKGVTKTVDSDIELPGKRDMPGFEREIKVAGDVDTLPVVAKKTPEGKGGAVEGATRGGGVSSALQMLAGLIFVIIVIAIAYAVVKAKGVTTENALRKLGVQLPGDEAAGGAPGMPAAPPIDPNMCPFCGQMKDATGACACSVTPGASPFAGAAPSAPGVPRLVGLQGAYAGQVFEVPSGSKVVGREPECDIALVNDTTSSRRHATVTVMGGDYSIRDEGSSNGTFVNGAKITEQKLMPGDEVQIGGTRFRFEV